MTIQSALSIIRSAAAIGVTVVEGQMQGDATVTLGKVLWMIGNGGGDHGEVGDVQEMSHQLRLPLLAAALPAKENRNTSTTGGIEEGSSLSLVHMKAEEEIVVEGLQETPESNDDEHSPLGPVLPTELDYPSLRETAIVARPFDDAADGDDLMRLYRGLAPAADGNEQLPGAALELEL